VHRVSDVRQRELHTAEPLVPEPSPSEAEITIAKLLKCNSPGTDQTPVKQIQAGGEVLRSQSHKTVKKVKLSLYRAVEGHRVVRRRGSHIL
jgi:hypothetical protein